MSLLKTVDELSYKKILSIAILIAILVAIPVAVLLVQQETKIQSRAALEKPSLATKPKAVSGPIPKEETILYRVYPWVGKIGDIVWVQGKNFGTNPVEKKLSIGGVEINDAQIESWEDNLIQAYIPDGVRQGGTVEVQVGQHEVVRSLPMITYDLDTKTKLRKSGDIISLEKGDTVKKVLIWTGDDEIQLQKHTVELKPSQNKIFNTQGLPLLTIVLLDETGKVIPYYVDPIEFGF